MCGDCFPCIRGLCGSEILADLSKLDERFQRGNGPSHYKSLLCNACKGMLQVA